VAERPYFHFFFQAKPVCSYSPGLFQHSLLIFKINEGITERQYGIVFTGSRNQHEEVYP
jgi:hypothetical protein